MNTHELASLTTLWRCTVRRKDATPPFDIHAPIELRALSEATALDMMAEYFPQLRVLSIERQR